MERQWTNRQREIIEYAVAKQPTSPSASETQTHKPEVPSYKERLIVGLGMMTLGILAALGVNEAIHHPENNVQTVHAQEGMLNSERPSFVSNRLLIQLGEGIEQKAMVSLREPTVFDKLKQTSPQLASLLGDLRFVDIISVAPVFPEEFLSSLDEENRQELARWVTLELGEKIDVNKDLPKLMAGAAVKQALADDVITQIAAESLKFPDDQDQNNTEEGSLASVQWHLDQIVARDKDYKDEFESGSDLYPKALRPEGVLAVIIDTGVDEAVVWSKEKTTVPTVKMAINEDEIPENNIDDDRDGVVDNENLGGDFTTFPATANTSDINSRPHGTGTATVAHAHPETGLDHITDIPLAIGKVCKLDFWGVGCSDTAIARAIIYFLNEAEQKDLHLIVNMSLGGKYDSPLVRKVIELAWASGRFVFVASAGNRGEDISLNPHYPASYPQVIAVGAVGPDRQRESYSNYGDGVIYAPSGIPVILPESDEESFLTNPLPRGIAGLPTALVNKIHGTSLSSPQVEGLATKIWERYPNLSNAEVVGILKTSVMPDGIVNAERGLKLAEAIAKGVGYQELMEATPIAYSGSIANYLFLHGTVTLEASLAGLSEGDSEESITWSVKAKPWLTNGQENDSWQELLLSKGRQLSAEIDTSVLPTGWYLLEMAATRRTSNAEEQKLHPNYALVLINNKETQEMEFLAGCQISSVSVASDKSGEQVFAFTALGRNTCAGIPEAEDNIGYLYLFSAQGELLYKREMPTELDNPWWEKENLWPYPYPPATYQDLVAVESYGIQSTYAEPPYHQNHAVQVFRADGTLVFQDNELALEAETSQEFFAKQWTTPLVFTEEGELLWAAHGKLYHWDNERNRTELEIDTTRLRNLAMADSTGDEKRIIVGGQIIELDSRTTLARLTDFFNQQISEYGPCYAADLTGDGKMEAVSVVYTETGTFLIAWNTQGIIFSRNIESEKVEGLKLIRDFRDGSVLILLTEPLMVFNGHTGEVDSRFPVISPQPANSGLVGYPLFASNPIGVPNPNGETIYLAPGRSPRLQIAFSGELVTDYNSPLSIEGIDGLTCIPTEGQITCAINIGSTIQQWRLNLFNEDQADVLGANDQEMSPLGPGNRANFR